MKYFSKSALLVLAFLFSFYNMKDANAQISVGGQPMSTVIQLPDNVPMVVAPRVDVNSLKEEDKANEKLGDARPFRYGKQIDVDYTLQNSGVWTELQDGSRIWRLMIKSEDALSVDLVYSKFFMPKGATFFVYNLDKSDVHGAFTELNNTADGIFSTLPVRGSHIMLEYYEPVFAKGEGIINVGKVTHAYIDILGFNVNSSEAAVPCHVNINCPEGAPWVEQKRSVARTLGGGFLCTGTLINNTAQNRTPYFLTAHHCDDTSPSAIQFLFNYEGASCFATTGPQSTSVVGATKKAENYDTDFRLWQLNTTPPASYNVYYSGWNRAGNIPSQEISIHHPAGEIKKISIDNQSAVIGSATGFAGDPRLTNGFWLVRWDVGMTEGGSSGSALFDENKRVIGQNLGGTQIAANCANYSAVIKYFGRFSDSWSHGGAASNQLKDWLDPSNTGQQTLDGLDRADGLAPTPNFSSDTTTLPLGGGTINFIDLSANLPTSWSWSFPGGTPSTSTSRNPTVTYSATGVYTVMLTATNSNGSNMVTKVNYIKVSGAQMNSFVHVSPANNTTLTTNQMVTTPFNFVWTKANSGSGVSYKIKFRKIGTTVDYDFNANVNGTDSIASLRSSQLDSLASTLGTTGDSVRCTWKVWAYNGADSLQSSTSTIVTLKRTPVGISQVGSSIPSEFKLYGNYPNPFNPTTKIKFDVAKSQNVKLKVYDMLGKQVAELVNGNLTAGTYEVDFNGAGLSSGIYFYRIETPEVSKVLKMMLIK